MAVTGENEIALRVAPVLGLVDEDVIPLESLRGLRSDELDRFGVGEHARRLSVRLR